MTIEEDEDGYKKSFVHIFFSWDVSDSDKLAKRYSKYLPHYHEICHICSLPCCNVM